MLNQNQNNTQKQIINNDTNLSGMKHSFDNTVVVTLSNNEQIRIPMDDQITVAENLKKHGIIREHVVKVVLPPNTKVIKEAEFYNLINLAEVILNDGLEEIGKNAFQRCNIREIEFPSSLRKVGANAFAFNKRLTKATINKELTIIPGGIFFGCDIQGELKFSSAVKEIGPNAFSGNKHLANVTLNKGLNKIGYGTFSNCDIKKIDIPSTVTEIGAYAFCENRNLTELTFHKDIQLRKIAESTFKSCNIREIKIPSSVRSIEKNAFASQNANSFRADETSQGISMNRVKIILNDGLETIDSSAFSDTRYEIFVIPSSVEYISGRETLNTYGVFPVKQEFSNHYTKICFPETFKVIDNSLLAKMGIYFSRFQHLSAVSFSEDCLEVGNDTFNRCMNLKHIEYHENVLFRSKAFNWDNIIEISIPGTVKDIDATFIDPKLKNVRTIYIDKECEIVRKDAFIKLSELRDIYCYKSTKFENGAYREIVKTIYDSDFIKQLQRTYLLEELENKRIEATKEKISDILSEYQEPYTVKIKIHYLDEDEK